VKNLDILYEDNFVIIINKPAGLAVQGGKNIKNSLDKIIAKIRLPAPLLVHRLDKDTSGVILLAKTKQDAARFSRLLNSGGGQKSAKQYTAVCAGCPKEKEGEISAELEINGVKKKSRTKYKVIKSNAEWQEMPDFTYSVLEIELGTGRMHQIRRHLAMIGCPILGDDKYGDFTLNKKIRKAGVKRLLLHAHRLKIKEANIDITAPCPLIPFT
jgi:23S rRNA pseudouridine955/2504/2580 synthase